MSRTKTLKQIQSIADLRELAKRRLPQPIFDCIDGGADDEITLARNQSAYQSLELIPRILVDVGEIDTSTTVVGDDIACPVILSPMGLTRLFHPDGEAGAARAAANADTIYALSAASSMTMEDVAGATTAPKWFQLYAWRDKGIVRDLIERSRAAGYRALCVTVDASVFGHRERDLRNGLTLPPTITARTVLEGLRKLPWSLNYLRSRPIELANIRRPDRGEASSDDAYTLADLDERQFDPTLTWKDAEWMMETWDGPFILKGILSVADAKKAVAMGASAIVVSNHGGRQLDGVPPTISVLPEIVEAVAGRAEILIDGGIRRGTDVVKAVALGARACMIGRPYVYGMGVAGEAGVARALELLREEVVRTMQLLGCPSLTMLGNEHVRRC